MNRICGRIFKNKKPDFNRLIKYGFKRSGESYIMYCRVLDGQFGLTVRVNGEEVDATVYDPATEDAYTLFLAEGAVGSFVGEVRAAYEQVLTDIAVKCFDSFVFKSAYAAAVIKYVSEKYGGRLEFLWEKISDTAVWRRSDNKKWYGVLFTLRKSKLGLGSDDMAEIINLHAAPEDVERMVDGKKIFGGWHMNKKHWITLCLDGSVPLEDICRLIDISYALAEK